VRIRIDASALCETTWRGHLLRFAIGGAVTVATGLVGKFFGPIVGGLFLAFPAIFPIGAATIEGIENEKVGASARGDRARRAALTNAAGAAMGSVGLVAFAATGWAMLGAVSAAVALPVAAAAWAAFAFATWAVRKRCMTRKT
jgi:hypothetical protein